MEFSDRQLVSAKIREIFPETRESVAQMLEPFDDDRVQLAILKLAEGDPDNLEYFIETAKVDWRDVLAWAEYPEEFSQATWHMSPEDVAKIRDRDTKQYDEWIQKTNPVDIREEE